jgi:hypothetical protein
LSLFASWVLFPVLLAAIGAGWGVAVERGAGLGLSGVLVVPLGLAAAIVAASLLTAWSVTAPAATTVIAVGAAAGLIIWRPFGRLSRWPSITAVAVLLVYGAPVILSGSATFAGYLRLDDTATWLGVTDRVMAHGRSLAGLPPSTYWLVLLETLGSFPTGEAVGSYPLGGFMLLGVGHGLTGIDSAWIFQPYLACCGAAVALGVYALVEPVVRSSGVRALVAVLAAQPALLYGYSLWGGIKELTAAFLLVLGAALLAGVITAPPESPRRLLPLAVAVAALIVTLGAGAAAWVVPALVGLVIVWALRAGRSELPKAARAVGWLAVATAVLALPMWLVLSSFLGNVSRLFSSGQSPKEKLGLLIEPLSGWQLAGIWPVGDFRLRAPTVPTVLLIGLALLAAAVGVWLTVRRRQFTVAVYVGVALVGCGVFYAVGSAPWVIAKALAISSPALLAAALVGAALLFSRRRAGLLVLVVIGAGVVWSNALAYHDATLAPRRRLAELQHIGGLVAGKGPTFVNEYEYYADRHFLRDGAPVGPADRRPVDLPVRDGAVLTEAAWADLDSFALSTLEPYRSIVTRRSPSESRPPSIYRLIWQGRYYQLWQRPATPSTTILEHIPLGESNALPYCGNAAPGATLPLCSLVPVAVPTCARILSLGRRALAEHARLVAYQRPAPIVLRADETGWPARWIDGSAEHTLTPTTPGQVVAQISLPTPQTYELWLDGNFARGFAVSVDGRGAGTVRGELSGFRGGGLYNAVHVADLPLSAGTHTVVLTYPHADLAPGGGINELTSLSAITLQPQTPASELIGVAPQQAARLCGRPLDWIELVRSSPA